MILSRKSHHTGFSLVELLVVILIISLLLTLGAGLMKNITGGNSLGSAVATSEALFDEARAIAVGKGTKSYVLVDINDPQNEDTYLRRLVVAYQKLNDQGEPMPEQYEVSSRGLTLPKGIYFSQEFSRADHDGSRGKLKDLNLSGIKTLYDGKYLAYEFNSEGICTNTEEGGTSFVIASGVRPLGQAPRVSGDAKREFGGFVVWRNGRTSLFRDPEQVGIKPQVTEF